MNYSPKSFIILLSICVIFLSCSKNNPHPLAQIVGKWYFAADSAKLYSYPGGQFIENLQTNIPSGSYTQFNSDGSGSSQTGDNSLNFTYRISGNKLIINDPAQVINGVQWPASTDTSTIQKLTNTSLVLYSESVSPPAGGLRYKNVSTEYFQK